MTAATGRPAAEETGSLAGLPRRGEGRIARLWARGAVPTGGLVLALAAICALALALPGQTVATKYLNDLFVILDGTHRVVSGQVPNRDFHTALGPLGYYLPALGYWLSGTLGAAMPIGMALLVLVFGAVMAHVFASRLRPVIAVPFAAFLLLIAAVPMNLGESVTSLSFGRFYNRIGWVALGTLLVMYLRPETGRARQDLLDGLCAALLTLVMLYTKVTYGLVALGFLLFMLLLDPRQRRWAALALGLVLAAGLVVEAFWRSTMAHVADLAFASRVSGGLRGTWGQITDHVLGNFADYVLLSVVAGLAVWRTRSLRDVLFYGYCAVAGFLIINQNFQAWGIISLHAAAAVAAESVLRGSQQREPAEDRWSVAAGTKLLFIALVLPTIVHCAVALGLHAVAAGARAGEALPFPNFGQVRLAQLWTWSDHDVATEYLRTVQDGARALADAGPNPSRVVVLDTANPYSAALGLQPPRGDWAGLLWDRTIDLAQFPRPEELLAEAEIVMEPKRPPPPANATPGPLKEADALRAIYGPHVAANFDLVRETEHWRVHRRRESARRIGCAAGCGDVAGLETMERP